MIETRERKRVSPVSLSISGWISTSCPPHRVIPAQRKETDRHTEKKKTRQRKEKHRKKRDRDIPSKETNPTQIHHTTLTKIGGYLDSLHVDQEERQRQTKQGNKSYTKTKHNADKEQQLP